ncbi:MAG: MerR family transcriptional regulator [Candidatus Binatia bacterium]|nr:MerR family transcriptional regulator [Candidatus Binatia bacterium]
MVHRYFRLEEVLRELGVDREFVHVLEVEEIIHPKLSSEGEPVLSAEDVERVRVARLLMHELEVNLAGVEIVLHLRDEILSMQRQFGEILEQLVQELRRQLPKA